MKNTGKDYNPDSPHSTSPHVSQHPVAGSDYPEGYFHGRAVENQIQRDREKTGLANGMILGIAVTGLLGLAVAAYFIFTPTEDNDLIITPPIEAPESENDLSEETESGETTIIERNTEIIREPVPAPEQPQQTAPDVNVTIPPAQPTQPAPTVEDNDTTIQVQPSPTQPEASSEPLSQPSETESTTPENTQ